MVKGGKRSLTCFNSMSRTAAIEGQAAAQEELPGALFTRLASHRGKAEPTVANPHPGGERHHFPHSHQIHFWAWHCPCPDVPAYDQAAWGFGKTADGRGPYWHPL